MTLGFLMSIVPRLPMLILYLLGVALAIGYASTLRGAATCAGAGFGCLALGYVLGIASQYWVMIAMGDVPLSTRGTTLALFSLVITAVSLVGTVLLMIAIFGRRTPPAA